MGRKVTIYKYESINNKLEMIPDGEGLFLGYSVDFMKFNKELIPYSVVLVEMSDGSVRCVRANLIKFKQEEKCNQN